MTLIPLPQVTALIRAKIAATGGEARFSSKYDIAPGHVRAVLAGKEPGKRTAKAAGLVKRDGGWGFV